MASEENGVLGKSYRVELDVFEGPLDLLLYLVRQAEVDIYDIPISEITERYLKYIEVLKLIDIDLTGDFLELAGKLLDIKTRMLLPVPEGEEEEEEDPRAELIQQLVEYKRFRDAAEELRRRGHMQEGRFKRPRLVPETEEKEVDIEEVDLWDLVSAFRKVVDSIRLELPASVLYDETPQTVYEEIVLREVGKQESLLFTELFRNRRERAVIIGLFLAILELIRLRRIYARQDRDFDDIRLFLAEGQYAQAEDS